MRKAATIIIVLFSLIAGAASAMDEKKTVDAVTPEKQKPTLFDRRVDHEKCDLTDTVEVIFRNQDGTTKKFAVPRVYLRETVTKTGWVIDPAEYIHLDLHKDNYDPKCKNPNDKKNSDYYHISVGRNDVEHFIRGRDNAYMYQSEVFIRNENGLALYRPPLNLLRKQPSFAKDILIPLEEPYKSTVFFACAIEINPEERKGCLVRFLLDNGLEFEYGLHSSKLSEYKEINKQISEKVLSFIVDPEKAGEAE